MVSDKSNCIEILMIRCSWSLSAQGPRKHDKTVRDGRRETSVRLNQTTSCRDVTLGIPCDRPNIHFFTHIHIYIHTNTNSTNQIMLSMGFCGDTNIDVWFRQLNHREHTLLSQSKPERVGVVLLFRPHNKCNNGNRTKFHEYRTPVLKFYSSFMSTVTPFLSWSVGSVWHLKLLLHRVIRYNVSQFTSVNTLQVTSVRDNVSICSIIVPRQSILNQTLSFHSKQKSRLNVSLVQTT
jgi:hypothetical protein